MTTNTLLPRFRRDSAQSRVFPTVGQKAIFSSTLQKYGATRERWTKRLICTTKRLKQLEKRNGRPPPPYFRRFHHPTAGETNPWRPSKPRRQPIGLPANI